MSEVKEALLNGQDIDQWHKQKIKQNDRQWFLIFCLFLTVFTGYVMMRNIPNAKVQTRDKDSVIAYQNFVIGIQKAALDSAVYFKQIKLK